MKSVLEEVDEHGPLFQEIEADTRYGNIELVAKEDPESTRPEEEEVPNIAGFWTLTHRWEGYEDSLTTMSLEQAGDSLTGYAVSSPYPSPSEESPRWTVSQEVSGFVRGNQFELAATSYEIIKSGGELLWYLDTWRGTVDSPNSIHGELLSEDGGKGTFQGERSSEDPAGKRLSRDPT